MMKQIKHKQSLNVFGFLKHIRQQRNYLVQTEEQYIFIHDAMLESLESGDTEVPSSHLSRYIQTLQTGGDSVSNASSTFDIKMSDSYNHNSLNTITHWPLLERQYKMVTSFRAKDFNVVSALKPANKGKNRSLNLIPLVIIISTYMKLMSESLTTLCCNNLLHLLILIIIIILMSNLFFSIHLSCAHN